MQPNQNNKRQGEAGPDSWVSQVDLYGNWSISVPTIDPWLSTSDPSWIEPLYSECFSGVFQSRHSVKREITFQIIVVNLAKANREICCPIDRRSWADCDPLPGNFGVSLIGPCVKALEKHGYLTSWRTYHSSKAKHPVTYIQPTERLLACSPMAIDYRIDDDGVIRCNGFKRPENYKEDPLVFQRYYTAVEYNQLMQARPEHQLYAVFKNNFQLLGRFAGSRAMIMPKADRMKLTLDGEKLFEVDIKSCLPSIALAKTQGIKLGSDFYDIEGFPRKLVKAATVRALSCKSRKQAEKALQGWINGDKDGKPFKGYKVSAVFDALERKIPNYEQIIYASRGLEFMADESLRMSLFLETMNAYGVKVFPIHDAVMGKVSDREVILEHFIDSFTINGIEPTVEIKESA